MQRLIIHILLLVFCLTFSGFFALGEEYEGSNNDISLSDMVDQIYELLEDQPDEVNSLIEELIKMEGYEKDLLLGLAANFYAELYYLESDWDGAIRCYKNAIDYFLVLDDSMRLASVYNNLGMTYSNQGYYDKSLEAYSKSLEIELDMDNQLGIAQSYHNMANVFNSGKHNEKAIEFYNRAKGYYIDNEEYENLAAVYNNLGNAFSSKKEYKVALENYENALKLYEELKMETYEARVLCNIGSLLMKQGLNDQAGKYLERALFLMKIGDNKLEETKIYRMLGDLYVARKDYQQAVFLYIRSNNLAGEYHLHEEQMNTFKALYRTYKKLEQWKEALLAYESYIELEDYFKSENPEWYKGTLAKDIEQRIAEHDLLLYKSKLQKTLICFIVVFVFVAIALVVSTTLVIVRRKRKSVK